MTWQLRIRHPQNFFAGLVIVLVSLFALWAASDLGEMTGFRFGAGTAPRLIAGLLGLTGIALVLISFLVDGPKVERISVRGSIFVVGAVLFFAATVGSWGVVLSGFVTVIIASIGSSEFRIRDSVLWAAALTVFCSTLFVGLLGLPLNLWPTL